MDFLFLQRSQGTAHLAQHPRVIPKLHFSLTQIFLSLFLLYFSINATAHEHRLNGGSSDAVIDTLSWRTFGGEPPWACLFWPDNPRGDSTAMWFQPLAPCTLKTIRIWQRTYGVTFMVDVYRARYDGHIVSRDSTNKKGWVGYNEDGHWVEGWRLGHPPLGEHLWGPFPLTLVSQDPDWAEIPTHLVGEPLLDGGPFFLTLWAWGVVYPVTFIGGEDENTRPYHFFRYFPDSLMAPGMAHKGWYLLSSSLWVEAIVSYSGNTPPVIREMSVQNDTYGPGPYPVSVHLEDHDAERPVQAGISSAYLVWDVNGVIDSTLMSGPAEGGDYQAGIPSVKVDDTVRYHISVIDLAGARSSNLPSTFTRLSPQNPEADILVVSYEDDCRYSECQWIKSLLDSLGYVYEYWNIHEHKGIDASISGYGWGTVFPFGRRWNTEGLFTPFPTRRYEGNIWVDFLASGTPSHPANLLYIPDAWVVYDDVCEEETMAFFGPGDFAFDFLGILSNECYGDTTSFLVGREGDPISGEFHDQPLRILKPFPGAFEGSAAHTTAREAASNLFVTSHDSTTGIRHDGGNFKTVYLPMMWEQFFSDDSTSSSSDDFLRLATNILEWFGTKKGSTGVADHQIFSPPKEYHLFQNYPNPFNPTTAISYSLPVQSTKSKVESGVALNLEPYTLNVTLKIFNVLGQEVVTLVDGVEEPGYHTVTWDASDMPSGIYFCRLTIDGGPWSQTRKMILIR